MFGIFRWLFNKEKDNEIKEAAEAAETTKVKNVDNYETEENGDIKIRVEKKE